VGALGGAPVRSARWRNGQRAALAPGVSDVAHEFGCRWAGRRGAAASAWVFAPPVTRGEARRLRADALAVPGCRAVPGVPRFGRPTVAVRCTDHGATTVALHGLFGDAWLSCSVTAPTRSSTGLVDRSEQWCVSVALAAAV
jgi:hypothetical protein